MSRKSRQKAIKTMIVTDEVGQMLLFCGATTSGSTADITQARQVGLVTLLKSTMGVRILADASYQGLGAHTAEQVVTPPYRKFRKNRQLGMKRSLRANAKPTLHDASASSTASPICRTGDH